MLIGSWTQRLNEAEPGLTHDFCQASQRIEGKESFEHGHSGVVLCVDAHPCRKQIASAAMNPDSTVRIWENNTDEV